MGFRLVTGLRGSSAASGNSGRRFIRGARPFFPCSVCRMRVELGRRRPTRGWTRFKTVPRRTTFGCRRILACYENPLPRKIVEIMLKTENFVTPFRAVVSDPLAPGSCIYREARTERGRSQASAREAARVRLRIELTLVPPPRPRYSRYT